MTEWRPIQTAPLNTPILVFGYWKPSFLPAPGERRMAVWRRDSRDPNDFYCQDISGEAVKWTELPEWPE